MASIWRRAYNLEGISGSRLKAENSVSVYSIKFSTFDVTCKLSLDGTDMSQGLFCLNKRCLQLWNNNITYCMGTGHINFAFMKDLCPSDVEHHVNVYIIQRLHTTSVYRWADLVIDRPKG